MGDAAGIGPEVLLRAVLDPQVRDHCVPLAIAHPEILRRSATDLGVSLTIVEVQTPEQFREAEASDQLACWVPPWKPASDEVLDVPLGQIHEATGRAAYECLVTAAQAALSGLVDAVTTAPLNKAALKAAGLNYPGHTEILGEVCGVTNFGMMLYLPQDEIVKSPRGLGVVHTTLHTSIRSVPELLSTETIAGRIELMDGFMRQLGCEFPRVAVCALNPHAGENGLFGDEEARIIQPAVDAAKAAGLDATGPLPADTLLRRAVRGEFDGVVAMYHDQGHIALKLIGFDRAVNITLGLPIIRTSPSHGTGFDIAGKGEASPEGMIAAIRVAAQLASVRNDGAS
jgi:4-hydroxythreonine-4-phosphate dehydrogenase